MLAGSAWLAGLMVILCVIVPISGVNDGRCYVVALFCTATWQKVCGVMFFRYTILFRLLSLLLDTVELSNIFGFV